MSTKGLKFDDAKFKDTGKEKKGPIIRVHTYVHTYVLFVKHEGECDGGGFRVCRYTTATIVKHE